MNACTEGKEKGDEQNEEHQRPQTELIPRVRARFESGHIREYNPSQPGSEGRFSKRGCSGNGDSRFDDFRSAQGQAFPESQTHRQTVPVLQRLSRRIQLPAALGRRLLVVPVGSLACGPSNYERLLAAPDCRNGQPLQFAPHLGGIAVGQADPLDQEDHKQVLFGVNPTLRAESRRRDRTCRARASP